MYGTIIISGAWANNGPWKKNYNTLQTILKEKKMKGWRWNEMFGVYGYASGNDVRRWLDVDAA